MKYLPLIQHGDEELAAQTSKSDQARHQLAAALERTRRALSRSLAATPARAVPA